MKTPPIAYTGNAHWLLNGTEHTWAEAHKILTAQCHLTHSGAIQVLAHATRLDQAPRPEHPAPHIVGPFRDIYMGPRPPQ